MVDFKAVGTCGVMYENGVGYVAYIHGNSIEKVKCMSNFPVVRSVYAGEGRMFLESAGGGVVLFDFITCKIIYTGDKMYTDDNNFVVCLNGTANILWTKKDGLSIYPAYNDEFVLRSLQAITNMEDDNLVDMFQDILCRLEK